MKIGKHMEQRRFSSGNRDSGRRDSRGGGRFGSNSGGGRKFGGGGGRFGGQGFGGRRFGGQRRFGSGFRRRDDEEGDSGGRRFFGSSRGGFGSRGRRFDRKPLEMHKAVCDKCKKDCEVPFKPTQGKPVFCRECFQKKREEEGY
jgi:CxxC-x17-CxxC domain-containing protein